MVQLDAEKLLWLLRTMHDEGEQKGLIGRKVRILWPVVPPEVWVKHEDSDAHEFDRHELEGVIEDVRSDKGGVPGWDEPWTLDIKAGDVETWFDVPYHQLLIEDTTIWLEGAE
jgi:hypothetical protein